MATLSLFMSMQKFPYSSWPLLALMRFFLSIVVLVSHLHLFTDLPPVFKIVESIGGKAAVLGFLLISGISIAVSYEKSGTGFFKRRFLRIYPLYLPAVLFTVFIQYLVGSPFNTGDDTFAAAGDLTSLGNILFLQGFAVIPMAYNQPLWSISVEVFFYLLVPLFFKLRPGVILLLILVSMFSYYSTYRYFDYYLYGFSALIYAWPWLTGFLLIKSKNVLLAIFLIVIGALVLSTNRTIAVERSSWITYTVVSLSVFLCIQVRFNLAKSIQRILNYLGELSYPIYLFHMPVLILLYYLGVRDCVSFVAITIILIIPINYLFDGLIKATIWQPIAQYLFKASDRVPDIITRSISLKKKSELSRLS